MLLMVAYTVSQCLSFLVVYAFYWYQSCQYEHYQWNITALLTTHTNERNHRTLQSCQIFINEPKCFRKWNIQHNTRSLIYKKNLTWSWQKLCWSGMECLRSAAVGLVKMYVQKVCMTLQYALYDVAHCVWASHISTLSCRVMSHKRPTSHVLPPAYSCQLWLPGCQNCLRPVWTQQWVQLQTLSLSDEAPPLVLENIQSNIMICNHHNTCIQ